MERRKIGDRRGGRRGDKREEKHKGRRKRGECRGKERKEGGGKKREGREGKVVQRKVKVHKLRDKSVMCLLSFALKLLKNKC